MTRSLLFILVLLASLWAQALEIPSGLSRAELDELASLLSLNTSTKLQSNPYPLGGYDGVEVGVSVEVVETKSLAQIGDGPALEAAGTEFESELVFPRLSVGKGLFNDVDIFLHFVPYSDHITEYGTLLRWSFYQAEFLPISVSALLHASALNVSDKYNSITMGSDLLIGINVEQFALYFGGGQIESQAEISSQFVGTDVEVGSGNVSRWTAREIHSFVGVQLEFTHLFAALQIDRYREPVYSAKIGFRY